MLRTTSFFAFINCGRLKSRNHNNEWDEDDYLEEEGEPMPPEFKFQNLYLIADSFEEFIVKLEVEDY